LSPECLVPVVLVVLVVLVVHFEGVWSQMTKWSYVRRVVHVMHVSCEAATSGVGP
jgi:putative heme iron utilization protein